MVRAPAHIRQQHKVRMDVASLASGRFCMFLFCMYMHLHLHLAFIRANACTAAHAWLVCVCLRENVRDLK